MPKVVITHAVPDVERWLTFKAERVALLPFATQVTDHVALDGSKSVAVTMQVQDVTALLAALASPSPELAAGMERHGVLPPLSVYVQK